MKHSKLISLILALCMLSALVLTGCGSSTQAATTETAATEAPAAEAEATEAPAEETEAPAAEPEVKDYGTLKVGLLGTSIKPVGVIVADAMGYFAEEGVNVEFEKVSSMNDAYMAVADGSLDVYLFSSTAAATFITQGITTLRVFGGTAAEGSEIMAAAGTPEITSVDDLIGKTIAVMMPETGQMVLKNYLLSQGYTIGGEGDGADVTFVYVNDSSTILEGCLKGEYDYCITNSCMGYYAEDYGAAVVGTVKQFVETYPCCRQTCNETTYTDHFDALVAFETATLRGYEYYLNNKEATLDILEEYAGGNRDFVEAQVYGTDSYTPVMRLSLDPDKIACVEFYQALANLGEIEDTVDVDWDTYVVTDVYGTALQNLMEREPDNTLWTDLETYFEAHD